MVKIIKKLKKLFTAEIMKPVVYKAFYKFVLALVPILLWDRFINKNGYFGIMDTGFFVAGIFYLMLAWFGYLGMDGMSADFLRPLLDLFKKGDTNKSQKKHGSMMDYVQQEVPDYDDLSDEDKSITKFGANLLAALVFILISALSFIF